MEVIYENEKLQYIAIDLSKVTFFLVCHGVEQKRIDTLRIHVCSAHSERKWLGLYRGPCEIYLYVAGRPAPIAPGLNETLLHELRHFMMRGYRPGESKLAYNDRPSEIDARAFSAKYRDTTCLLSVSGDHSVRSILTTMLAWEVLVVGILLLKDLGRHLLAD